MNILIHHLNIIPEDLLVYKKGQLDPKNSKFGKVEKWSKLTQKEFPEHAGHADGQDVGFVEAETQHEANFEEVV